MPTNPVSITCIYIHRELIHNKAWQRHKWLIISLGAACEWELDRVEEPKGEVTSQALFRSCSMVEPNVWAGVVGVQWFLILLSLHGSAVLVCEACQAEDWWGQWKPYWMAHYFSYYCILIRVPWNITFYSQTYWRYKCCLISFLFQVWVSITRDFLSACSKLFYHKHLFFSSCVSHPWQHTVILTSGQRYPVSIPSLH